MKALVLHGKGEPFSLEEVPDPTPGSGEAVARVITCGTGLTIQHVRAGRMAVDYPRIIGHEITGEIVALGTDVDSLAVGDAVTAYFYLTCGYCRWCRSNRETLCENFSGYVGRDTNGGYAEFISLRADTFLKLPEGLDYQNHPAEVGVITDAIATPVKVLRRARVKATDTVGVFGAGGGLGIHMVMMANWAHSRVVAIDVRAEKFDACREAGAEVCVDATRNDAPEAILEATAGRGLDVAIDFVSSRSSLGMAANALAVGGRLITLGGSSEAFEVDPQSMLVKELELMGSRYATKGEVTAALDLVARGDVWPLVTEVAPMAEAEQLHVRVEEGLVTGRAALRISEG